MELLRSTIHHHTKDIVMGVYKCEEGDDLFKCADSTEIFPRFQYWDRTKKDATYVLEKDMSFSDLILKTKELIVPEQKLLKSQEDLENFLKSNKHAMVANIDAKDSESSEVLNELVKSSKFDSNMVFSIAKLESSDIESDFVSA